MKHITRREMLRGLAAGPALAFANSLVHAAPAFPAQLTASLFQRLNIIFHGMFIIEFAADQVNVYLPPGPSGYAYLAGTWMQETTLSHGGEYRLSGMMTGPRPELRAINPEQTAVLASAVKDPSLAFCKLVLPFPDYFMPLRMIRKEHGRNFFTGSPQPIVEPSEIPEIVVFSYDHPDSTSRLQFRPLAWTPVILAGVINLHIWDAPAKPPTSPEAQTAFTQLTKLIGAPTLRVDGAYREIEPPAPDENPMVPGLTCQEEWSLIERLGEPDSCSEHRKRKTKKAPFENLPLILY
jgi:hypothetical protein